MSSETTLQKKRDKTNNNFEAPIQLSDPADEAPVYIIKMTDETRLGFYVGPTPLNLAAVDCGPTSVTAMTIVNSETGGSISLPVTGETGEETLNVVDSGSTGKRNIFVRQLNLNSIDQPVDYATIALTGYPTAESNLRMTIETDNTTTEYRIANIQDLYRIVYGDTIYDATTWAADYATGIVPEIQAHKIVMIAPEQPNDEFVADIADIANGQRLRILNTGDHTAVINIDNITIDHHAGEARTYITGPGNAGVISFIGV